MKKFLFVCLLSLLCGFGTSKAADVTYVLVVQRTSDILEYKYSENPRLSFSSSLMDVHLGDEFRCSIERSDIKDIHFRVEGGTNQDDGPEDPLVTEVEEVPVTRFQYLDNATVRIEGTEAKGVAVYDVSGRRQPASILSGVNAVEIRFAALPAGIYVIKTTRSTYKIVKR